jgi:hypothetical protein
VSCVAHPIENEPTRKTPYLTLDTEQKQKLTSYLIKI